MTEEKKVTIQNKNTDMIGGGIFRSIFWFSVPLLATALTIKRVRIWRSWV